MKLLETFHSKTIMKLHLYLYMYCLFCLIGTFSATLTNRTTLLKLYDQYYVIENNPTHFVEKVQSLASTNPCAQYVLGNCYMRGRGVSQNKSRAIELWKEAYLKHHPVAARNLAVNYFTSCPNEALEYAENGCKWGSGHACVLAGMIQSGTEQCEAPTAKGCYCPKIHNQKVAMKYYMKGLELGCATAAFLIGEENFDNMDLVAAAGYFGAAYFEWGVGDGYDGNWIYQGLINSLNPSELVAAEHITEFLLKKYPRLHRDRVQLTREALNLSVCD